MDDVIDKLLVSERSARAQTFQAMTDNKIPFVDPLPGLKRSVGEGLYASSAGDMHPNRNGYRVIGGGGCGLSETRRHQQADGGEQLTTVSPKLDLAVAVKAVGHR